MTSAATAAMTSKQIPFDASKLDALMDAAGIDVIVATTRHNIQYLLGGYRFFFFETMEAAGTSRYLAALIYQKGKPERTTYVGADIEKFEQQLGRFWVENLDLGWIGSKITATRIAEHMKKLGSVKRIGIEEGFLPVDANAVLRGALPNVELVDAVVPLERLRAVKTPEEIGYLREASDRVTDAMMVAFTRHCVPGATKQDVFEALRREEVERGLVFDYLLMTAGTSLNRSPSDQQLASGDILSLDSGGNYKGYIGDLCRMGIIGTPDQELINLLGWVDEVQMAARRTIRPGARGGDCWELGNTLVEKSPHAKYSDFIAHGMGLVTHEAPHLMNNPRWSYAGDDIERPLEAGMCLSLETTMRHPKRGFIKLEDTVLVTPTGCEGLGDKGRGWNRAGQGK
jgi:Xaa-Pro aminopeptidase